MGSHLPQDWNTLDQFFLVRDRQISEFDHFIHRNTMSIEVTESQVFVRGRLYCACDSYLDIDETVIRRADKRVRTVKYSYHAGVLSPARRDLFRYDNAHARRGHADEHHKHRFDPETGAEIKPPIWIGEEARPLLGEVLAELESWCLEQLR